MLYKLQEFQTWSNDLKRRGPAGLRDLPCFPYLRLPSFQCPKKHLNSHLLWKRVGRTALAPASCAAGCSFVLFPIQEKPFVQSLSHVGICSGQEPEATWNCGLRSLEEGDRRKAKRQAELMAIWKYESQSWQQICVSRPHKGMWMTSASMTLSVFLLLYNVFKVDVCPWMAFLSTQTAVNHRKVGVLSKSRCGKAGGKLWAYSNFIHTFMYLPVSPRGRPDRWGRASTAV